MFMEMVQSLVGMLTPREFAQYLDSTLLRADASMGEVLGYIEEAKEHGFKCVVLSPYHALSVLSNGATDGVSICSVVGFPMGFTPTKIKILEAEELLSRGVEELDVVMNIQAFKNGRYEEVLEDISSVVDVVKSYGAVAKVIIESPILSFVEKVKAVDLVVESGAHYVKTSTGTIAKTSLHDVYTIAKIARGRIKIKASGGFKNAIDVLMALAFGASRIGTSSALHVYKEFLELQRIIKEGGGDLRTQSKVL